MMASSGAVGAGKVDYLEMAPDPLVAREEALEVFFRFFNIFPIAEAPALCASVDVCVYGKRGELEGLGSDNRGGLMADTRERFESGKGLRDPSSVFL